MGLSHELGNDLCWFIGSDSGDEGEETSSYMVMKQDETGLGRSQQRCKNWWYPYIPATFRHFVGFLRLLNLSIHSLSFSISTIFFLSFSHTAPWGPPRSWSSAMCPTAWRPFRRRPNFPWRNQRPWFLQIFIGFSWGNRRGMIGNGDFRRDFQFRWGGAKGVVTLKLVTTEP